MHDSDAGNFDDHEPGDVNGNVDPAYAKKLKQDAQGARAPRADRPAGNANGRPARPPRPQRAPRTAAPDGLPPDAQSIQTNTDGQVPQIAQGESDGSGEAQVRPARPPREPRQPRAPREPRVQRPPSVEVAANADGAAFVPNDSAPNVDGDQSANAGATDSAPAADGGNNGANFERGPRRNRRGGRGRNARGPDDRNGPRQPRAPYDPNAAASGGANSDAAFSGADGEHSTATPRITNWVLDDSGDGSAAFGPNPGAFGDPSRPMDRSARRNRNHREKRAASAPPVRIGQGPRDRMIQPAVAMFDEEGNAIEPSETEIVSGVNDQGERDGERLHKVLAQQGLGSRRNMEALIERGEVDVNGVKARVGQIVNEQDRVHVNRRKVTVKLGDDNPRILIYHKQSGEIVSRDDPEQRDTVFDRLPRPDHGKWVAVGRLDYNSEGLMLFTTYGELANRFMHPRYEILREYSVRTLGELTPEQEDALMDGIELDDGPARLLSLDRIDRDSDAANHWYRVTLNEGRNREVRRMFEHMGLVVSRLIRTTYGCVQMPSWLKRGQSKLLDEAETFEILESVGLRSKKKLEKAARFGGRNRIPQQPLGPMRSATEHEAIYNPAPADAGAGQGRGGRRQGGRGGAAGQGGQGRGGPRFRTGAGATPGPLQQQQFPGFGGATEMQTAGRRQRTPGNKVRRGADGEVNGNVAPGYRGNAGNGVDTGRGSSAGRSGNAGRGNSGNSRGGRGGRSGANAANNGNVGNAGYPPAGGNGPAGGADAKRGRRRRGRGPGTGATPRTEGAAPGVPPTTDFE
ncbi:MAG: pseudouridine synthase [Casimicrobium sp.]